MTICGLYANEALHYPTDSTLFRPQVAYPEYPFDSKSISSAENPVYVGVRDLFRLSGLDPENYGSAWWNPLGEWIKPGMHVLVKPNLVMHENAGGHGIDCLYTHPSVIAAVVDYIVIALKGEGSIVLADAPMQSCDWEMLIHTSGLDRLVAWYWNNGIDIRLKDLRGLHSTERRGGLSQQLVEGIAGRVIDLGDDSSFANLSEERMAGLRITNYDPAELARHHAVGRHEYFVSQELLDADVVVNLPKAKTHRKAGLTGALKNMVGVNVRKEYLPHHTVGSAQDGFDEYEKRCALRRASACLLDARNAAMARGSGTQGLLGTLSAFLGKAGKLVVGDVISEGSWWGNDTIWRTVLDLNKIVFHADSEGLMRDKLQRRMVVVCDMVTIGQGEGPLLPEPGHWKMLSFCDEPVVHDCAMARLMGSDVSLIPTIRKALTYGGRYSWGQEDAMSVACRSNVSALDGVRPDSLERGLFAKPANGWAGHFERITK